MAAGWLRRSKPNVVEDERLKVALDEARRSIDQQSANLNEVRSRCGITFGVAAIVATFAGTRALSEPGQPVLSMIGVLAFLCLGLLLASVLFPQDHWKFAMSGTKIIKGYVDDPADINSLRRNLALHHPEHFESNRRRLNRLFARVRIAIVLVGIEVLAFLADMSWI